MTKTYPAYSVFEDGTVFEEECEFGVGCKFGDECEFGDNCKLGVDCKFGDYCIFGNGCVFRGCTFGSNCTFKDGCVISAVKEDKIDLTGCKFGDKCSIVRLGKGRGTLIFTGSLLVGKNFTIIGMNMKNINVMHRGGITVKNCNFQTELYREEAGLYSLTE